MAGVEVDRRRVVGGMHCGVAGQARNWRFAWIDRHGNAFSGPAGGRHLYRRERSEHPGPVGFDRDVWLFAGELLERMCRVSSVCGPCGARVHPDPRIDGRFPDSCPLCGAAFV